MHWGKGALATFFVLRLAGIHLNDRFDGARFRRLADFAFSHFEEVPGRACYRREGIEAQCFNPYKILLFSVASKRIFNCYKKCDRRLFMSVSESEFALCSDEIRRRSFAQIFQFVIGMHQQKKSPASELAGQGSHRSKKRVREEIF